MHFFLKCNLSDGIFSMYGGLLVYCLYAIVQSFIFMLGYWVLTEWQAGWQHHHHHHQLWLYDCGLDDFGSVHRSVCLSGNLFCEFRAMQSNCQMSGLAIGMGLLKPEQPNKSHHIAPFHIKSPIRKLAK